MFVVACNLVENTNFDKNDLSRVMYVILNNEVTAGLFSEVAGNPVL